MIDIGIMSNEELSKIIDDAHEEMERRQRIEREKDWTEVCDAIRKYLDKWNFVQIISYCDNISIDKGWIDLSEFGVIRTLND